jgi:IPT/TIG domain/Bacterial Ig-like domain (group 2)
MSGTKATFRSFVLFASSFVCLASAQQPLLQITSPSNQSTVLEGQTLNIAVSADPSVQGIYVMTEHPLPSVQPTSNSNLFSLPLPTNIPPGVYKLTAVGFVGTSDVESVPIQIDVERQDAPVSISVKPRFVTIGQIGSTQPINVQGTFSDGSVLSLKNSFLISYASETPSVVTVAPGGLLTAVGPGQATVSVLYGTLGQPGFAATTFQVIVPPPSPTGPAPVITSVTPTSGTPGVTQVMVTGSNFGNVQGSGFVQFGTLSAASVNSWTNQQIVATVPTGSKPGVALVYQNGLYSNQVPFTTVVPSITSLSPTSGTGGTPVTITGTNFGSTQGTSTILFNGAWTNAANWSNSSITATVSPYATSGNVVVIVNGVPSNAVPFTTAPSISGISPTMGIAGASVTITGSNFGQTQGTSTVTFNGIVASPTAWGATSISVSVPAGATSGPVVVTVNGVSSNLSAFTVGQIQPLSIDARVSADSSSAASTISTGAFSTTSSNELLLAFVSADASSKKSPNTTVTAISGGGLTWQLVQRTNAQLGTSEIWRAFAKNVLSNVAVTVTLSQSVAKSVTIVSFIGADPTGINGSGAIGAVGTANAATGAPTASLVTTRNNSWVFGVGNDLTSSLTSSTTNVHTRLWI